MPLWKTLKKRRDRNLRKLGAFYNTDSTMHCKYTVHQCQGRRLVAWVSGTKHCVFLLSGWRLDIFRLPVEKYILLPASAVKQLRTVFGNHTCIILLTSGYLHRYSIQHPDIRFGSVISSGVDMPYYLCTVHTLIMQCVSHGGITNDTTYVQYNNPETVFKETLRVWDPRSWLYTSPYLIIDSEVQLFTPTEIGKGRMVKGSPIGWAHFYLLISITCFYANMNRERMRKGEGKGVRWHLCLRIHNRIVKTMNN
jgi:hypothetical protein